MIGIEVGKLVKAWKIE